MNLRLRHAALALCCCFLASLIAAQDAAPQPNPAPRPVSYASVNELNTLLGQLEQSSQATQDDLAKLRIERWKTDSAYKRQSQANADSIRRNLQAALPEIMGQLRNLPEDLTATFKLYRNLDALYDVLGSVTESAGAFGSKDEFQSLSNDLNSFERTRRSLGERLENLTSSKESEIASLRTQIKTLQAQVPPPTPKKIIVDDNEPPKKPPVKKKSTTKNVPKPPSATPQNPPPSTPPQQ